MNRPGNKNNDFYQMVLWPNRSFEIKNIKFLFGILCIGFAVPILPFFGSSTGTLILTFSMVTLIAFFSLFIQSYSGGNLKEIVRIDPKEISVTRIEANGEKISWRTNSYWARVKLYPEGQIVENYLTLVGGNREIELGSFLSPEERTLVRMKIENILERIKSPVLS